MTQTPESPSATIRRAATLMRERAQAATPGPWASPLPYAVALGRHDDGHLASWVASTDIGGGDGDITDEQARVNAEYIASMHPLVGLDLAELLDAAADSCEQGEMGWTEALAVARRYLGETEPSP